MSTKEKWYNMPFLAAEGRSWMLVICASLIIVASIVMSVVALLNLDTIGWITTILILLVSGVSTVCACLAIRSGNPGWILLNLLLYR